MKAKRFRKFAVSLFCMVLIAALTACAATSAQTEEKESTDLYDVIFLGFPNWWYTAPMAVFSFIEEYDLSGKTVIPFCAHGTGGLASSVKDITDALPDTAEVLEPIGVYRPDVDSAQPVINEWLDSLGYTEESMTQVQEMTRTDEGGGKYGAKQDRVKRIP